MPPPIAVVVCTYEREAALADALADVRTELAGGALASAEVVVVDQGADPAAVRAVVTAHGPEGARVVWTEPGLPRARNVGLAETTAPVVVFFDDDVRLHPGAIAAHLAAYRDPRVGGVVGRIDERVVRPNARRVTNRVDRVGRIRTRLDGAVGQPIETLKGCNLSVRRSALARVGGFDPGFAGTSFLEDADLSERLRADGWALWFEPAARVIHLSAPSGGVRQRDPLGAERWRFHNTGRFVRKHRGPAAALATALAFGAIACRRAWERRDPTVAPRLVAALARGWRSGGATTA